MQGTGFRVQGVGFSVKGAGFGVQGAGFTRAHDDERSMYACEYLKSEKFVPHVSR